MMVKIARATAATLTMAKTCMYLYVLDRGTTVTAPVAYIAGERNVTKIIIIIITKLSCTNSNVHATPAVDRAQLIELFIFIVRDR